MRELHGAQRQRLPSEGVVELSAPEGRSAAWIRHPVAAGISILVSLAITIPVAIFYGWWWLTLIPMQFAFGWFSQEVADLVSA